MGEPGEESARRLLGGPWRGDAHAVAVEAAAEAGLPADEAALASFLEGFKAGAVLEDPRDGAVVLRGRSPLSRRELENMFAPMLRYLGVPPDGAVVRTGDGTFELRVARRVADRAAPALGQARLALKVWVGFGLLGLAIHQVFPGFRSVAAVVWGIGLLLGAVQLRRGLATGRAALAARLAMGLAMLAHEKQLVLPPADEDGPGPGRDRALPEGGLSG